MKNANAFIPFWTLPFRPFFLITVLTALFPTLYWTLQFSGYLNFNTAPFSANQWHANEMIFGFLLSAIMGFLLTASTKWTNTRGIHGYTLIIFVCLFLITRAVMWTLPFTTLLPYQVLTLIPLLWLCLHLLYLFSKTNSYRQYWVALPLVLLIPAQYFLLSKNYNLGVEISIGTIRYLIVVITGRIIPFFTRKALDKEIKTTHPVAEKILLLTMLVLIFSTNKFLIFIALILNLYRLYCWDLIGSRKNPILFVLYLAYLWLIVHFILLLFNIGVGQSTLHALTYGCFGLMILGIIHRVTLGHTGRKIQANAIATFCYYLLFAGAIIRVFAPLLYTQKYLLWIFISGLAWVVAFFILSIQIVPMLLAPRVDGREY